MEKYIRCSKCNKKVSTPFTPHDRFVLRAWVECPECIEAQPDPEARIEALIEKTLRDFSHLKREEGHPKSYWAGYHYARGLMLSAFEVTHPTDERDCTFKGACGNRLISGNCSRVPSLSCSWRAPKAKYTSKGDEG